MVTDVTPLFFASRSRSFAVVIMRRFILYLHSANVSRAPIVSLCPPSGCYMAGYSRNMDTMWYMLFLPMGLCMADATEPYFRDYPNGQ